MKLESKKTIEEPHGRLLARRHQLKELHISNTMYKTARKQGKLDLMKLCHEDMEFHAQMYALYADRFEHIETLLKISPDNKDTVELILDRAIMVATTTRHCLEICDILSTIEHERSHKLRFEILYVRSYLKAIFYARDIIQCNSVWQDLKSLEKKYPNKFTYNIFYTSLKRQRNRLGDV